MPGFMLPSLLHCALPAAPCPQQVIELKDAGHCVHDEVPEVVNREILAFIEQRVLAPGGLGDGAAAAAAAGLPTPAAAK